MADLLVRVIVGNIVFHPEVLRDFLKKSHYFMLYKAETETIIFKANDDSGGREIFSIRNASYENAAKLAVGLGLTGDGVRPYLCWTKWNPSYKLDHDGSEDAEKLRMEMLSLGMPFKLHKTSKEWSWNNGRGVYQSPMWTVGKVLVEIRKEAELYKKQLDSKP